jgi:NDP-sugar pyrophosphorylase family protein
LALFDNFQEPILLINADILTDLNFHELMDQHRYRNAVLTVASKVVHTNLDLGVLDVDSGGRVEAYREKPRVAHRFGIGIYVVDPSVKQFVPFSKRLDMPELINTLIAARYPVACYEHSGNWVDIGTHEEYARLKENAWVHALTDSKALGAMVAASVSSDIVYP